MTSIYNFRSGPTYRGAAPEEQFLAAMDQPLSLQSTLWEQAKGGALESFGLGTALRDFTTPQGVPQERSVLERTARQLNWFTNIYDTARDLKARTEPESAPLNEEAYKNSAYFREGIKWDQSMTEDRAAALAILYDAKKVREFYAQKRPITSFIGNLAGQAVDPINYIPIAGPTVRAASVARYGRVAGEAAVASLDAAANTALFGLATAEERAKYGDDVSWQATVSQIAMAALIGSAFGTLGGAIGARTDARAVSRVEERLSTLQATQEARVALNESIGAIAQGEDINLSVTAAAAVERQIDEIIAYHGSPFVFDRFDINRINTGEGAQAYGRGLYFAADETVAAHYRDTVSATRLNALDGQQGGVGRLRALAIRQEGMAAVDSRIDELQAFLSAEEIKAQSAAFRKEFEDELADLQRIKKSGDAGSAEGQMYQVGLRAKNEDFLDWDKPLSEQPQKIQDFFGTKGLGKEAYQKLVQRSGAGDQAPDVIARQMADAGIPGIQYLDAGSRGTGEGTRNYVVFDDSLINIRKRNGVDVSTAKPDTPPEGRTEAETRLAKPENYKALAEQYKVDPETGSFVEEGDIAQLETEGRLTAEDKSVIAEAQKAYEDGDAYGEALKAAVGCLI